MPIIFETENIDEEVYTKLLTRQIYMNLGYAEGQKFLRDWNYVIYPLEAAAEFSQFFGHVEAETNLGIAWGVTMPTGGAKGGDMFGFVRDTRNPMIVRSNFTKLSHENGHSLAWWLLGTSRCTRKHADPGAGKGTAGPCYVTKIHDQFYGEKKFRTYWVRYGFIWLPVKMLDLYTILH